MTYTAWSVVFGEQPSASKWNQLGTNDAHFYSFLGDNLAWQTFSPTWSNLTVGNGTVTAFYTTIGKAILGTIKFILGTTSSVSTNPSFTAPATGATRYGTTSNNMIGTGYAEDAGVAGANCAFAFSASTSNISILTMNASGTYGAYAGLTSTAPITWGSGDFFTGSFFYERS